MHSRWNTWLQFLSSLTSSPSSRSPRHTAQVSLTNSGDRSAASRKVVTERLSLMACDEIDGDEEEEEVEEEADLDLER